MDWNAARQHCQEKDWTWTLDLIDKYQKEMKELKDHPEKMMAVQKKAMQTK